MDEEIEIIARRLIEVDTHPSKIPKTTIALLTDSANVTTGFVIGAQELRLLLGLTLGLATEWADDPALEIDKLIGPQNALPANRILIEEGRNDKECALRVFVGKVGLTFLIPLSSVLSANADLAKRISHEYVQDESDKVN